MKRGELKEKFIQIGANIRRHRLAKNLTRQEFAEKVLLSDKQVVSHQQIAKYEDASNVVNLAIAHLIAQALNITLDDLVENTKDKVLEEVKIDNKLREVTRLFSKLSSTDQSNLISLLKTITKQ